VVGEIPMIRPSRKSVGAEHEAAQGV
jgi:hypothetical protein